MSNYRLVAIDMDGTLLNNDLKISPAARKVIKEVEQRGIKVTLCTGRMFASAKKYADELGINVPLITYNGALVKNSRTGKVIYERWVPMEEVERVVKICRKYGFQLNVYCDDKLYVENVSDYARMYAEKVMVPLNKVDDFLTFLKTNNKKVTKMLAIGKEEELDMMRREYCSEGTDLYITRSQDHFLEFLHREATKGFGLQAVARYLSVKRDEILAIGDNENDLEMFRVAGTAVVMGNARKDIKAQADYVTASNDDDGVVQALEELVLGKKHVRSGSC